MTNMLNKLSVKQWLILLFLAVLGFTLIAPNVSALTDSDRKYLYTPFYDPDAGLCDGTSGGGHRGTNISVIGDSLTAGMRDAGQLAAKLQADRWTVKGIQGVVSDTVSLAMSRIDKNEEGIQDDLKASDTVVIALGTNPESTFGTKIDQMIKKVRDFSPNAQIYWMNAYTLDRDYGDINDAINAQAKNLKFSVIDWKAEATKNPTKYPFDGGIHHTAEGYSAKADFLVKSVAGGTTLSGNDNRTKIWNFLIEKGLSPPQAAGIMGNIQTESANTWDPTIVQGGSHSDTPPDGKNVGYGIVQWTPGTKILRAADQTGSSPGDLAFQLNLLWGQLTGTPPGDYISEKSAGDAVLAATDVREAAKAFMVKYERPADQSDTAQNHRADQAVAILAELGSTTPDGSVPAAGEADTCGNGPGNSTSASAIVKAALSYAWPAKGHGLEPKPEYAAAISQFNPGAPYGGADCGAFVATVMIATGADPDYPRVGTIAQQAYVKQHSDKYDVSENVKDVSELLPGDILIVNTGDASDQGSGHTYIFVGPQEPNGFNKADASGGDRMPNLGNAEIHDSLGRGDYIRARLK